MPSSLQLRIVLLLGAAAVGCGGQGARDAGTAPAAVPSQPRSERAVVPPPAVAAPPIDAGSPNVPEFEPAFAGQTRAPALRTRTPLAVTEIARGFDEPWALAFLPDRRMLVTEKPSGKLYVVTAEGTKSAPVRGMPRVDARGQGGLLDVELAPDHVQSGVIYFSYYEPRPRGNGLAVARARLLLDASPRLQGSQVVFRMQPTLDSIRHAGGRLVFAGDGTLFVGLGDRAIAQGRAQARDLASHFGKVVRISPDGAVPKDNPFTTHKGARPEIWTLGHRNILSAALDARGQLWTVEMGPAGGDELNLIERGKDYGWPTIGYGEEYDGKPIHAATQSPGLEQPVYYWDPVISPSGMAIYSGALIEEWKGDFFIGGLSSEALVRLRFEGNRVVGEERLLTELRERIREVVEGPDGALYVLTDDDDGRLLRVAPKAARAD